MRGGGALNSNIWDCMQQELGFNVRMTMLDVSDDDGEEKEAMNTVLGRPLMVPQGTDKETRNIMGKFSPRREHPELTRKSVAFGGNFEGEYLPPVKEMVFER